MASAPYNIFKYPFADECNSISLVWTIDGDCDSILIEEEEYEFGNPTGNWNEIVTLPNDARDYNITISYNTQANQGQPAGTPLCMPASVDYHYRITNIYSGTSYVSSTYNTHTKFEWGVEPTSQHVTGITKTQATYTWSYAGPRTCDVDQRIKFSYFDGISSHEIYTLSSFNGDISNTATTYTFTGLSANTHYIIENITRTYCGDYDAVGADFDVGINFNTLIETFNAGIIGTAQTICYNTAPALLTTTVSPINGTGSYTLQWYSGTTSGATSIIAGATGTTYQPPSLTSDKWYRKRVVDSATPKLTGYTASIKMTVYANYVAGTIAAAQTINYGSTPANLTTTVSPSGGNPTGYTLQWYSGTTSGATNIIAGAISTTHQPPALYSDKWYRKKVTNSCGVIYTAAIKMTVYPQLYAGTIGTAQSKCYNTAPALLTTIINPTGGTGSYSYQWQSGTTSSPTANIAGATSTTYQPPNLLVDTWYRKRITDSNAVVVYTPAIKMTVYANYVAGTIGTTQSICYNTAPNQLTTTVSPTGGNPTGYTYQWLSGTTSTPNTVIAGATSTIYQPTTLTQNTYYRKKVTNSCGVIYTSAILITVYNNLTSGTIGTAQSICYNTVPALLTTTVSPTGGNPTGYTYQWYSGTTSGATNIIAGATSTTYQPVNLTNDTWYKKKIINSCGVLYTSSIKITVYANLTSGTIDTPPAICYGQTPNLITTLTSPTGGNPTGYTYQWYSGITSGATGIIIGATSTTYQPIALLIDTWYKKKINNSCGILYTPTIEIYVNPPAPTVVTNNVTNITQTTATSGGYVLSGISVTARGVCYSINPMPTTADTKTTNGNGLGAFISYLTGLTNTTFYYVRAYAGNSCSISYGNQVGFQTAIPYIQVNGVVNYTNVTTYRGSDGTITISSPTGGLGTYEYSIDNGSHWYTSPNFTGLKANVYQVMIRDAVNHGNYRLLSTLRITQPNNPKEMLQSCELSLQKIMRLFIASRKIDTSVIDFPIEYTTISGSSDSIIRVTDWNYINNTLTIGGQVLDYREVSIIGQGENAEFTEEYSLTKQGKVYTKNLTFSLPRVNFVTNSAVKEFIFTADGSFAISKAICFIVDENNKNWVCGVESPMILDSMELDIADDNFYKLVFKSVSQSRTRNYQIQP